MVDALHDGNALLIADFLEAGGSLTDYERDMLVKFLRGDLKRGRGNRRKYAQVAAERGVRLAVMALQQKEAIRSGVAGSLARAIDAYLERHASDEKTLDKQTVEKHAAGGLSATWLRSIEDARQRFFEENPHLR
jgi:hypothetical protein